MKSGNPRTLFGIPERRSSRNLNSAASMLSSASNAVPTSQPIGVNIPGKGVSTSPIRRPETLRKPPSRTFVPSIWPTELLDTSTITHPRVGMSIRLSSPVYMGGATVEGIIYVTIDGNSLEKKRKPRQSLSLNTIFVTLVGVERCKGRQEIFRVLKTDLVDDSHPPPASMTSAKSLDESWDVAPSDSEFPFCLDLPVSMGPPPYISKHVGITYWLSAFVEFAIGGKSYFVRESRNIIVLTVHDRTYPITQSMDCG